MDTFTKLCYVEFRVEKITVHWMIRSQKHLSPSLHFDFEVHYMIYSVDYFWH